VLCELPVKGIVDLIKDEIEKIKTRDKGWRQVDVPRNGQIDIVSRPNWICGCQNRRPGIQRCDDTSFGDGYSLLFL